MKEKDIYHHMNLLKLENTILHGHCWMPEEKENEVMEVLQNLGKKYNNVSGAQLQKLDFPQKGKPPTYYKLNVFTAPFQVYSQK